MPAEKRTFWAGLWSQRGCGDSANISDPVACRKCDTKDEPPSRILSEKTKPESPQRRVWGAEPGPEECFFFFTRFSELTRPDVFNYCLSCYSVPMGSPSRGGDVMVYVWHEPAELAHSVLFCSCVYFCLYGPFNCISLHKFSRQLSVFSFCSCGLSSVYLLLSAIYLFMKVSFGPDIIPSGWLGSKHQLTN